MLVTALLASDPDESAPPAAQLQRGNGTGAGDGARTGEPEGTGEISGAALARHGGRGRGRFVALYRLRHGADAPWLGAMRAIRERHDPLARGDLAVERSRLEG